jgi:hypothetical protein
MDVFGDGCAGMVRGQKRSRNRRRWTLMTGLVIRSRRIGTRVTCGSRVLSS